MPSFLRKYSLADFYAGPGGLSLGFKQSGFFQPVVAVESNSQASETYENNLGVKVITKDVANVAPNELLKVAKEQGYKGIDVVVGGPPCQAFTTSNTKGTHWKKIKEQNEKNGNCVENQDWINFWKIIEALEPRAFVAENVMGFRTDKDVMSDFIKRSEPFDYVTGHCKLDAQFYGVPQRRKRIFVIGLKDYSQNKDSLLPKNPPKTSVKLVTVRNALGDLPKLSNDYPGSIISKYKRGRPTSYQSLMKYNAEILYDHVTHSVHPKMAERFQYIPQGYNLRKTWIEGKIPEDCMRSSYVIGKRERRFSENTLENMHSNIYRRLKWDDVSWTITHVRKTVLIHPLQDRLISVRESARLQSFPDWYRFSGSLNQQYQQIANAVPPLLAKAVAIHIREKLVATPRSSQKDQSVIAIS